MKIFQQILKKEFEPAFLWKVPSVSEWGTCHEVSFDGKNWGCDCIAFKMSGRKRTCKHIKIVRAKYDGNKIPGIQHNTPVLKVR